MVDAVRDGDATSYARAQHVLPLTDRTQDLGEVPHLRIAADHFHELPENLIFGSCGERDLDSLRREEFRKLHESSSRRGGKVS